MTYLKGGDFLLTIRKWNVKPHLDIESYLQKRENGLATFNLRLNKGNIVDLTITEYVNPAARYGIIKTITIAKLSIPLDSGNGGRRDAVGVDNV